MLLTALLAAGCDQEPDVVTTDPSAVATAAGPPPAVTTSGSPEPARAVGPNIVNVRLVDYAIEMQNQLPAARTTFEITNDGDHQHNFEIEGQGIEEKLAEPLKEGESATLTVELKPGRYRVYCPVGDHATRQAMETIIDVI